MRIRIFLSVLAGCAAIAGATHNTDISSSTVDTVLRVINTNGSGSGIAIVGRTTRANAAAIYGVAAGSNGIGLRGSSTGSAGAGVYGSGGDGQGLWGQSSTARGVYGSANGAGGIGMWGEATHASGLWGVRGLGPQIGVYGSSTAGEGVRAASTDSAGLYAVSVNGSGVRAITAGNSASGVVGISTNSGHHSELGNGVYGEGGNAGVFGKSDINHGVYGEGSAGVFGRGLTIGTVGYVNGNYGRGVVGEVHGTQAQGVAAYANGDYSVGVYVTHNPDTGALAGYFDGDVVVTGNCDPCSPSDAKFKKNIQPLNNGLAKVLALKPKSYEMRSSEFKNQIALPQGKKMGLIAQELEAVLPELVHPVTVPAHLTADERKRNVHKEPVKFKAVDYNELIPVLIGAIQELEARVKVLEAGR